MTTTAPKSSRKSNLLSTICKHGDDASFVANLILNWHKRPSRKLAGLARLLTAGSDVRTAAFSIDILLIDGQQVGWDRLEVA